MRTGKHVKLVGKCALGVAATAAFAVATQPAEGAFGLQSFNSTFDNGTSGPGGTIVVNSNTDEQMYNYSYTSSYGYHYDVRSVNDQFAPGAAGTGTIFYQLTLTNALQGTSNNWNAAIGVSIKNNASDHGHDIFTLNANGAGPTAALTYVAGDNTNGVSGTAAGSITVGTTYDFWFVLNGSSSGTPETVSIYEATGSSSAGVGNLLGTYAYPHSGSGHLGTQPFNPITFVAYANESTYFADNGGSTALDGSNSFNVDNVYFDNTGANLANPTAPVPEPASLGLVGAGSALLLRRSRKSAK